MFSFSNRENFTLELLSKFRSKLENAKQKSENYKESGEKSITPVKNPKDDNNDDIEGDDWLSHKLEFFDHGAVLAKDAATKEDDWYDVYDPRNPLNKRRRGDEKESRKNRNKH